MNLVKVQYNKEGREARAVLTTYLMFASLKKASSLRAKGLRLGQYLPLTNWWRTTTSFPALSYSRLPHSNVNLCL